MSRPLVIAEAGVNHNGSVDVALKLIDVAKEVGADIVKFQTFTVDELVAEDAPLAPYQELQTQDRSQRELLSKLALSRDDFVALRDHAVSRGIEFLSTAFDVLSLDFLVDLGIRRVKIPSGEITNFPLLASASRSGLPILMSTGMAAIGEIEEALDVLDPSRSRREDITLLHCTTAYPAPDDEVNMLALSEMSNRFGYNVGYSDHTTGSMAGVMAVTLGASVVEKHLTLDRSLVGPDHAASLDPDGFRDFVRDIEAAWSMLGDGVKNPSASERENMPVARKSVYFRRSKLAGSVIEDGDLVARRPGLGISPMEWPRIVGSTASRDFRPGELFEW